MQPEIIKKAFIVWHEGMLNYNPNEGYPTIEDIPAVYAETRGKAKNKASDWMDFNLNGKEATFLDLKVKRYKEGDKLLFEGVERTRNWVTRELDNREFNATRRQRVEQYPDDTMFYIQNGIVGNAPLWWGLGGSGYVCQIEEAQAYTKKEVLATFVNGRKQDIIWEASHVLAAKVTVIESQRLKYSLSI